MGSRCTRYPHDDADIVIVNKPDIPDVAAERDAILAFLHLTKASRVVFAGFDDGALDCAKITHLHPNAVFVRESFV